MQPNCTMVVYRNSEFTLMRDQLPHFQKRNLKAIAVTVDDGTEETTHVMKTISIYSLLLNYFCAPRFGTINNIFVVNLFKNGCLA